MPVAVKTAKILVEVVAAISDAARAQLIRASRGRIQVTATTAVAVSVARKVHARHGTTHRASCVMISNRAHRAMKCSGKTHAARASTWASSAITLTNASQPAMCLPAFRHQVCLRAVLVVAGVATVAVAVAVLGAAADPVQAVVDHAQVAAAEAAAVQAVGFSARSLAN